MEADLKCFLLEITFKKKKKNHFSKFNYLVLVLEEKQTNKQKPLDHFFKTRALKIVQMRITYLNVIIYGA